MCGRQLKKIRERLKNEKFEKKFFLQALGQIRSILVPVTLIINTMIVFCKNILTKAYTINIHESKRTYAKTYV